MPAGNRVKDSEEVRIERRLIEHLVADPVAAGDLLRPGVVAARVAEQHVEKWSAAQLPDVHEPHDERDEENQKRHWRYANPQCSGFSLRAPRSRSSRA